MRDSVTVHMNASPDAVWALVSDVTRVGEYSPETFEATWTRGATGPAVGAHFKGHVKRNEKGPTYWTLCTVTSCEPGREFGFAVGNDKVTVNNWKYVITPAGDGCDVTESFELQPSVATRLYWAVLGKVRGKRNRNDMHRSLERIRAIVEE